MVKPGKEYKGNVPSHSLKVVGIALTSSGEIDAEGKFPSRVFCAPDRFLYKKAVLSGESICGCIMLGDTKGEKEILKAIKEGSPFESVKKYFEEEAHILS
jgi:NAD(P)H-nitrite reductase large subunit